MTTFKQVLLAAVLLAGFSLAAAPASAQYGYYNNPYAPYSYREMSRNGTYHGYWRDMGFGMSHRTYNGYYIPQYDPYRYQPVYPPPGYYAPPPAYRYR